MCLKKILSGIGALTILSVVVLLIAFGNRISQVNKLDSKAIGLYMQMFDKVLETGDAAKAMVIKRKMIIPEGMTKEEAIENAIEIMDDVGSEYGLALVDHKVMSRAPYIEIRSYCSPTIGKRFIAFSPEFIGFMPCRLGFAEDVNGDIYIYTMSLDLMINGGYPLTDEMLKLANEVREGMYSMMEKAASGDS